MAKKKPTPKPPAKPKLAPKKPVAKKVVPKPVKPKPKAAPSPRTGEGKPAAAPPTPAPPSPAARPPATEAERDRLARKSRERATTAREAGKPPDIADPARREACRKSLRLHCETYHAEAFYLGWSPDHLRAIDRIEEAVTLGALFALAMDRGKGKTTLCRVASLWATLNALCRYGFLIGATDGKAVEALDAIKTQIRFNELLAADYPEVSHYARALNGIANRASGQTCDGGSTMIEWSADGIVYPTVPPPANWPRHWPLRADGRVPTSGVVVATSGLTGEGLRGSLKALTNGEMVRPDFVLLDDPQTPVSARSKTQNLVREQLVSADVLGMAGPGKKIAAVMPCTVIEPGDMVDRVLDRAKHPLWRGERSGILKSLPTNLAKWDAYYEVYSRCAQMEPPDFSESNAYYVAHRAELEAGAVASWEARKNPDEVSAVQHAMHLRFRDPFAFAAEYMNDPKPLHAVSTSALDPEAVAAKVTNLPRLVVPHGCTRLTAFVDVGAHVLWYCVVGWDERFGGSVIDYGPYPDQTRPYFSAAEARPALGDLPHMAGKPREAVVFAGVSELVARVVNRGYTQEATGGTLRVERCLIDANDGNLTDVIYDVCRRDAHAALLVPSHGKFIGAGSVPMANWQRRDNERAGEGWRLSAAEAGRRGRKIVFDTNRWKSFVAERLRTPMGAPGCLTLFAAQPAEHEMFADHCAAEYPVALKRAAGGLIVDEWKDRPGRDNHLWDCLVGAAVAASLSGLKFDAGAAGGAPAAPPPVARARPKLSDLYARKHGGGRA